MLPQPGLVEWSLLLLGLSFEYLSDIVVEGLKSVLVDLQRLFEVLVGGVAARALLLAQVDKHVAVLLCQARVQVNSVFSVFLFKFIQVIVRDQHSLW